jgi:hypothetical protein
MKQNAPKAPQRISSRDMLKMLISRLRDFMAAHHLPV